MKIQNKNSWYTILVTLMIIGFLIVVTTGVLNLVLREMNDNRGEAKYLQAYAWAEWAMELALLKIKQNWYWVYDKVELLENADSQILRDDKNNKKEILISYDLNSKTNNYNWSLAPFEQAVIPLFYTELDWTEKKVTNIELTYLNLNNMWWNIISEDWDWIWWDWEIWNTTIWKWKNKMWWFSRIKVNWNWWFLDSFNKNYLVIVNLDNTNNLEFNLISNSGEEFTKPISKIISSAKIWNYKQNLETTLDNTAFLSILKYSIYSQ